VSLRPSRLSIASTKSDASESSSRYFWMDHPRRHRRQPAILPEFLCGANGVEMLRLGCCLVSERGVNILAQVHDVLMVESPADAIDEIVARTQEAMAEASAIVLDGFWLRSDAKIARWPDRYMDERRREFWGRVPALLPNAGQFSLGWRRDRHGPDQSSIHDKADAVAGELGVVQVDSDNSVGTVSDSAFSEEVEGNTFGLRELSFKALSLSATRRSLRCLPSIPRTNPCR
jgi:hypothetical protein